MPLNDWDRIKAALFRADEPPSAAFVARVMARIEAEERERTPAWTSWLTPALGFAFAAGLLFYARPKADVEPFPDTVISSAAFSDLQARWSLASEPQTVNSQEDL